ncbi:hypothetical protein RSAG8_00199, partial [Rhizoctonia solani AG-8 WAC10335]
MYIRYVFPYRSLTITNITQAMDPSQTQPKSTYYALPSLHLTHPVPVTALSFDPVSDVLWTGSATGLVTGYFGNVTSTGYAGLFAGLSLEGTILIERKDANRDFYGSDVPANDILNGRVPPPEVAGKMYEVIEAAEGLDDSGLPSSAYVPDATGAQQPVPQGGYTVGGKGQSTTVFDADQH